MSVYMTLIFGVLMAELAIISILVLPLPHSIRKRIVQVSNFLFNQLQVRITIMVCGSLIFLMFIDSAQKSAKYPVNHITQESQNPIANNLSRGYNDLSSSDYLARKFYNQRNFYLSGIVLFMGIAIPTNIILLNKIIKWDDKLKGKENDADFKLLASKEKDLETLQKQVENLQKAFNEKADLKKPIEIEKKKDI